MSSGSLTMDTGKCELGGIQASWVDVVDMLEIMGNKLVMTYSHML